MFFNRGNLLDNWTDVEFVAALDRLYTPGTKTGVLYASNYYFLFIRGILNRTDPPQQLKERYRLEGVSFEFPPSHFLFETFDRKFQQYIEADLINYNIRKYEEDNNYKAFKSYKEPFSVLTLGELEAGFVVCVVPLCLSIFVFCIEWMVTLKDLVLFMYIFEKYFVLKHLEQAKPNEMKRA